MYDRKYIESSYGEFLHRVRNSNRKQYWYGKALDFKNWNKEMYQSHAEEIERIWQDVWHRRFRAAMR